LLKKSELQTIAAKLYVPPEPFNVKLISPLLQPSRAEEEEEEGQKFWKRALYVTFIVNIVRH
jgi:hypothetical protein